MGVTLPTFHFVGKVCFSIQKLNSLHMESAIAGAAILSNLALTPPLPVPLYTGIERRRLKTLSLDICGILNVPETWDRGDGGRGPGSSGRVNVKTDLRSQVFLPVDEKAIQSQQYHLY